MELGTNMLSGGAFAGMSLLILIIVAVELVLKGIALWKAARLDQTAWFVILLIVNTAGILPLIYIFAVAKPREKNLPSRAGISA